MNSCQDTLLRIFCGILAMLLFALAMVMTITLLRDLELPTTLRARVEGVAAGWKIITWSDLKELRDKLTEFIDLDARISEILKITNPGPPPSLWHPLDRYFWSKKREAYEKAQADMKALQLRRNELADAIPSSLRDNPKRAQQMISLVTPMKATWNALIAPLLHFLLIIAILKLGFRLSLRLILLSGVLKPVRL